MDFCTQNKLLELMGSEVNREDDLKKLHRANDKGIRAFCKESVLVYTGVTNFKRLTKRWKLRDGEKGALLFLAVVLSVSAHAGKVQREREIV